MAVPTGAGCAAVPAFAYVSSKDYDFAAELHHFSILSTTAISLFASQLKITHFPE